MGTDTIIKEIEELRRLIFEKNRLETFKKNWKEMKGFKKCTRQNFAAAGFYNITPARSSNIVKCFACQKELGGWEKEDDPWEEHVKRGSKCPFVIFKNKEKTTVRDFLQLHFESMKNLLNNYFEEQKSVLKNKETYLLESFDSIAEKRRN